MSNPFFGALGGGMNFTQLLSQLRTNPMSVLRQAGYNVPESLNNPQQIIQHLMNSGQITQEQVNNAQMMAQSFGMK